MNTATKILQHPQYTADDYAYLRSKGWSDTQILKRWTSEQRQGAAPCTWQTPSARAKLAATLRANASHA
jgi:protease II